MLTSVCRSCLPSGVRKWERSEGAAVDIVAPHIHPNRLAGRVLQRSMSANFQVRRGMLELVAW